MQEPPAGRYRDTAVVRFLGRRWSVLDLSHEIADGMPVYPGHMKVATWTHLSHAECRLRLGGGDFGYAVKGIVMCDHDSSHIDAVSHFNEERGDLSADQIPIGLSFTEAAWIDVSDVPPRTHITLERVRRAMAEAGLDGLPRGGSLLYYTGAARLWDRPLELVSQYPGLDEEASRWILDGGVVNVLTDAPSTDNPADVRYPNHRVHAERLVNHTELVANIDRIPRHQGFWLTLAPLRIVGATGSPVRIFALWEADEDGG
jgi:kynurenine formamidase